ncbi:MAG: pabC [Acidimicrobiales bacterium]|nr:pabC [Acidimicrobiales bacterium]
MSTPIWVNGEVVAADDATVSALDHGMTVGDGVFETLRVYGGVPFAADRHLDRLARSATGLGLPVPDRALLARAIDEVIAAGGLPDCRLRLTVTAGNGPLGSGRTEGASTIVAAVAPLDPVATTTDVITVPWVRNERSPLAGLKTTSYAENVVALARAKEAGASEALFANTRDELCEGTGTNVFVVVGGELLTPPLSSGCLAGVTRELVLESTEAVERALPFTILADADEVFLTSSTREVQAVAHIDGRMVPDAPGPVTRAAAAAFRMLAPGGHG